jgi:SAM-dependent methyltransferase
MKLFSEIRIGDKKMTPSIQTIDHAFSKLELSVVQVEAQTVVAYDRLAPEYDSAEHATTRKLERLSIDVFSALLRDLCSLANVKRVLEIGCGTGALSSLLLQLVGKDAEFVFTDSSASMLNQLHAKLVQLERRQSIQYTQSAIMSHQGYSELGTFDLIVCGMGDPYFLAPAIANMRQYCAPGAHLLLTLPEKSWAIAERLYRLKVPLNRTRFRLLSGEIVVPFSFVYSEEELSDLLRKGGFELLEVRIESESFTSQPEPVMENHRLPVGVIGALARTV